MEIWKEFYFYRWHHHFLALLLTVDQQEKTKLNRVINIGNNKPENLLDFINIRKELGLMAKKTIYNQQGDVYETYADISHN